MSRVAICFLAVALPLALSAQQLLMLKDGRQVRGRMISGTSQTITFQDENGRSRRYSISQIESLDFTGLGAGAASTGTFGNTGRTNQYPENGNPSVNDRYPNDRYPSANDRYPAGPRQGRSRSALESRAVPAGTEFSVRTNETIDSSTATEGRTYSATVARDVVDNNGTVLIPRGSDAQLVIRNVSQEGTLSGPELSLDVQSVSVGGRRYLVSTEDVQQGSQEGIGKNRRTAEMVGGGAALGTLLGAIAGGGKGAVIGAIAGAAAGGTVQVLTKGKQINVPAETLLTFRLDQPVRLRPM
ncbi:MAG: hypothetical protein DMG57_16910 [Acidobacteria bacterium]|nr:MAG: hypothetical protein DMG57_16910 [Acidobacteriota bacterium]